MTKQEYIEAERELELEYREKQKEEVTEDVKTYLARSIDAAIPIVNTRGDIIPQKFRNMQEEWMANNKVKKYSGGGTLLN